MLVPGAGRRPGIKTVLNRPRWGPLYILFSIYNSINIYGNDYNKGERGKDSNKGGRGKVNNKGEEGRTTIKEERPTTKYNNKGRAECEPRPRDWPAGAWGGCWRACCPPWGSTPPAPPLHTPPTRGTRRHPRCCWRHLRARHGSRLVVVVVSDSGY